MFDRIVNYRWRIALAILSVLGIAAGLYLNRFGVDVEPDSAVYMTAGIHFAHGQGMSMPNMIGAPQPMTWFPPVTPWMVAICEGCRLDIQKSFGVFNAISWGVLIGWEGWLAKRSAGGRSTLGILAAGAILTSSSLCTVYGFLYSEPLFLLCLMGALAALAFWWERPGFRWVALAGFCVGLGLLTRYVGLTLVMLGGLTLLVRPGIKGRRMAALVLFGVLSVGPMFGWHLWNKIVRFSATAERTLAWHPITGAQIDEGIATLASFIVPTAFADSLWATRIIVALMVGVAAAAVWMGLGRRNGKTLSEKLSSIPALVGLSASFIVIYLAFLVVSISIADASTPLDWRILSIIVPPGVIVAAYLAFAAGCERGGSWARRGGVFAAVGMLAILGYFTFRVDVCRETICWMPGVASEVLDALRAVPAHEIVFSNAPCEVYMAERRKTEDLPHPPPEDGWHTGEGKDFEAEIAVMQKTLAARGGWVVYWKGLDGAPSISLERLRTVLPVIETKSFEDGALLHVAPR